MSQEAGRQGSLANSTFNQECIDRAATLVIVLANKNFVATLVNGSDNAKNFGQEVVAFRLQEEHCKDEALVQTACPSRHRALP